jgi:hypothetical protein
VEKCEWSENTSVFVRSQPKVVRNERGRPIVRAGGPLLSQAAGVVPASRSAHALSSESGIGPRCPARAAMLILMSVPWRARSRSVSAYRLVSGEVSGWFGLA